MEGQIGQAIDRAIAERTQLLEKVIIEGNEDSVAMGATLLALIGTEESATKLLQLIKQHKDNFEFQEILMFTFVSFSPHRYTRKQELFDIFPFDQREYILEAYEQIGEVDLQIIELPSLLETLTKAIDWATDDSGD